jgi:hypothetical protein
MAVAEINNLIIDKGVDFEATFNILSPDDSPFSLNGYTGISKIRKYPNSPTSHPFRVEITIATGEVKISMASTVTSQLSTGRNYFDVILNRSLYGNSSTFKAIQGTIIVSDTASL